MHPLSRSSAVGSALRSGRRGRAFESPLLDKNRRLFGLRFFVSKRLAPTSNEGAYPLKLPCLLNPLFVSKRLAPTSNEGAYPLKPPCPEEAGLRPALPSRKAWRTRWNFSPGTLCNNLHYRYFHHTRSRPFLSTLCELIIRVGNNPQNISHLRKLGLPFSGDLI